MPDLDHHRLMLERALQWQTERDADLVHGCAAATSGEVSQYLSTLEVFLRNRETRIWPHEVEEFLKHYSRLSEAGALEVTT